MINIEEIYHEYLLNEGKKHKQKYEMFAGWFSASSAGSCHRKQWYKINDYEVNVFDKEHKDDHKDKEIKKTYADNVINVTFGKSDKC